MSQSNPDEKKCFICWETPTISVSCDHCGIPACPDCVKHAGIACTVCKLGVFPEAYQTGDRQFTTINYVEPTPYVPDPMELPAVDDDDTHSGSSWLTTDAEGSSDSDDEDDEDSESDYDSEESISEPSSNASMDTDGARSAFRTRQAAMTAMSVMHAVAATKEAHKECMMELLGKLDDMENLLNNPYLKAAMWDVKECALNIMSNL